MSSNKFQLDVDLNADAVSPVVTIQYHAAAAGFRSPIKNVPVPPVVLSTARAGGAEVRGKVPPRAQRRRGAFSATNSDPPSGRKPPRSDPH